MRAKHEVTTRVRKLCGTGDLALVGEVGRWIGKGAGRRRLNGGARVEQMRQRDERGGGTGGTGGGELGTGLIDQGEWGREAELPTAGAALSKVLTLDSTQGHPRQARAPSV